MNIENQTWHSLGAILNLSTKEMIVDFEKQNDAAIKRKKKRIEKLILNGYTDVTEQTYMKGTGSYGNASFAAELRKKGYSVIIVGLQVFSKKK